MVGTERSGREVRTGNLAPPEKIISNFREFREISTNFDIFRAENSLLGWSDVFVEKSSKLARAWEASKNEKKLQILQR